MLVGVAVVLLVGFTGYQALKAKTALEQVAADFDTLSGQLAGGDQTGARATLADAQRDAREALDNTHGPGWWLSGKLPQVGPNVQAVRAIAEVADRLTANVLPDVVAATNTLEPANLRPVKGRVDLAPIRASAPAVARASSRLSVESRQVQAIDTAPLAPQIAAPVQQLQAKIADADDLADRASRAVRLLPAMLGGNGKRTYLFLFQNNAEIRSTGGIPGAFATLTARDGKIGLGRQDDAGTLGGFTHPPTSLTAEEKALFGQALGTFPQDVNFTPDFPRSAELISGMVKARTGRTVDGVVSVDPVALSYLLRGTGPVKTVGGRVLTPANAVELLLSQVYAQIPDPARQNVFFNAAARSVFDAVSAGTGNPRGVLDNLVTAADERRLLIWSAHPAEQRILAPTAVGGSLPTHASEHPEVGVYLNAARPYKLDYYLDYDTSVTSTGCADTRQDLSVKVDLRSRVPRSFRSLSQYVAPDVPLFGRGTIVTTAYLVGPVGGTPRAVTLGGEEQNFQSLHLDGRPVVAQSVAIKPGTSQSLTVDWRTGPGQTEQANLQVTPGVRNTGVGSIAPSACR